MLILILLVVGVTAILIERTMGDISPTSDASPQASTWNVNQMDLPDVLPENQGGNWSRAHDGIFLQYANAFQIPFALVKAHAIRESALKPNAYLAEPTKNGGSYGLMQILWWPGSQHFQIWGYTDDAIGDGSILYDPGTNVQIACQIIQDNWKRLRNIRDTVNAYNTGVRESVRIAPGKYVDNVLNYYSTLCNGASIV